jgi:PAS domain S-box-containing protein
MDETIAKVRTNILMVDDRPQNLLALEAILEPLNQNLVRAYSGEEALKHLLKTDFAVILLDVQMPGIDGFETARLIKEREKSRYVPIIFLTAISKDEQFVFKGYTVGAVDYLSKPFDPDILRSKVAVFVDLFRKNEQIRRQAELLQLNEKRERDREVAELRRAGEQRYKQLAESMPQMVLTTGADGAPLYHNQRWYDYTGLSTVTSMTGGWDFVLHADGAADFHSRWQRAVDTGEDFDGMYQLRNANDGSYRWHLIRAVPLRDESATVTSWIMTCTDIDDRKRGEESLQLLAEASTLLATSLDYRRALGELANLCAARLVDWCIFDVLGDDGAVHRVAAVHREARQHSSLQSYAERYPFEAEADRCPERVLRSGEAEFYPDASLDDLARIAGDPARRRALEHVGVRGLICVPLLARGRAIGAMTFATSATSRAFTEVDLSLVNDLARRAAAAVDNAQLYEIAERERGRLQEANRAKDEFLAVVSHELRTPLNSMLGWTQLLKTGKLEPALVERAVETIERNAKSQAQLVGDLLDVSRIITGKLRLKVRPTHPASVINAAIDSVRPAIKARNIQLRTDTDAGLASMSGDPERLQQVIWNLLSNAIKFTPAGGHISVSVHPESDHVAISVSDSGIGIDHEFLPYVFDRFRQADSSSTRTAGGLGLGLSIVKHLVELHGGTVRAESGGENQGATFTVTIPAVPVQEGGEVASEPARNDQGTPLDGLRVLLVEDEDDAREACRLTLEQLGATTWAVASAAEAFETLRREQPDILLSDIGLPGESGYDLIQRIRDLGLTGGGSTPAIALTAYASVRDRERALEAGFQEHVAKPIDPTDLVSAIQDVLQRSTSVTGADAT